MSGLWTQCVSLPFSISVLGVTDKAGAGTHGPRRRETRNGY